MVARLKLAEEPEPLSPERQKLASAISRRDEFQKRVVALEAAAATARDDERAALNDLERWREYLPTAVEAEVKIRVDAAIGKPTKKLEKSSAEARRQISELDETINTLKATREAMEKELEKTSRVITHPYPADGTAVRLGAGAARAWRMAASAVRPARRPVATTEQRSA
jgi:chromosome segregation ATPase